MTGAFGGTQPAWAAMRGVHDWAQRGRFDARSCWALVRVVRRSRLERMVREKEVRVGNVKSIVVACLGGWIQRVWLCCIAIVVPQWWSEVVDFAHLLVMMEVEGWKVEVEM